MDIPILLFQLLITESLQDCYDITICHDLVYLMPNTDLFFFIEWTSNPIILYCIAFVETFYRFIRVSYYSNRVQISSTRYISFYFLLYKQINDQLIRVLYWESVPLLLLEQMLFVFVVDIANLYNIPINTDIQVQFVVILSYHPFDWWYPDNVIVNINMNFDRL